MGEVWAARHQRTRARAAVKIITALTDDDTWTRTSLRNEVRAMARLSHPGIVRILDHGVVDAGAEEAHVGLPCIVMDQVDGGSLVPLLGRLPWSDIHALLDRLLLALAHAHAHGLIHRDLKPGNVLVPERQGPAGAMLTDFGLTHPLSAGAPGDPQHARVGTPSYMSPEQIDGAWRLFGAPTDLYGLGCVAWALVTGKPPFRGDRATVLAAHRTATPPPLVPRMEVPAGLEDWLRSLLAKAPRDRPQHAADAMQALAHLGRATRPLGPPSVPARWTHAPARQGPPLESLFALRAMPVVGRTRLQNALWSALRRCVSQGGTHTVVLSGSAGTGKSHLARWLCEASAETGAVQVLQVCHSGTDSPLDGLEAALRRHLATEGLPAAAVPALLSRRLPTSHLGTPAQSTELFALARDPAQADDGSPLTGLAERQRALVGLLERLAAQRPLVIWLDDLQWAEGSVGILPQLMARPVRDGPPILIVSTVALTGREPTPWVQAALRALPTLPRVDVYHVGPLAPEGRRALVRQLLGLAPTLSARVEDRTAGNPLFAVQLIGDWVQRGLLIPSADGLRLRPGADTTLPSSLYGVWAGPLERVLGALPHSERLGLELAALLGVDVGTEEWLALCDEVGVSGSLEAVEALLEAHLARAGPEGPERAWSFVHGMLREVLVQQSWQAGRAKLWHLASAMHLDGRTGTRDLTRRARHLLAAGGQREALEALRRAAQAQWESGDLRLAEGLIDQWRKGLIELAIPTSDAQWGRQALMQSGLLRHRGDLKAAGGIMRRALDAARRHDWPDLVPRLLMEAGDIARQRGQLDQAEAYLVHAQQSAGAIGDGMTAAVAIQKQAVVQAGRGRHQQSLELAQASRAALLAQDRHVDAAVSLLIMSQALLYLGRRSHARAGLIQAGAEYARRGCRWGVADVAVSLAYLARQEGDLDDAELQADTAIELLESMSSGTVYMARLYRAWVALDRRHFDDAEPALSLLWRHFHGEGLDQPRAQARAGLLLCDAGRGRWRDLGEQLHAAERELAKAPPQDDDVSDLLDRAARHADLGGHPELAARLRVLALRTARQADDQADAG